MRICFVLSEFALGGAEKQALILANGLRERGHDICFIGFKDGHIKKYIEELKFEVETLKWPVNKNKIIAMLEFIRDSFVFVNFLNKKKIDVLMPYTFSPNIRCGLLWRITGVHKCIWNQRDAGLDFKVTLIRKLSILLTPAFISNSKEGIDFLIQKFGVSPTKITLISNGIEPFKTKYDKLEDARNAFNLPKNGFIACMIGNISTTKDHDTLINAWSFFLHNRSISVPACLVLAGRFDNAIEKVNNKISTLQLHNNIKLLNFVSNVDDLLFCCDIAVYSSLSEGCPNGILECMSAGLAIVTTDIPAISTILPEKNKKYRSSPGDDKTFGKHIIELETDTVTRKEIGRENKKYVTERFGVNNLVNKVLDIIA